MTALSLSGVFAPVLTPVDEDLNIDLPLYIEFCRWLLDNGCHGLVLFGTNSEATSFSVPERMAALDAVIEAGIPAQKLVVGNGTAAVSDGIDLARHAIAAGCHRVMTLPPFYYPKVSDDGLYRAFAHIIERVGDPSLEMYFYHIPQVSGIALSADLLDRLASDFPGVAAGVKDSTGNVENLRRFHQVAGAHPGFSVFCGTESLLLANLRGGGAGCISGMANLIPDQIRAFYDTWQAANADGRQEQLNWLRNAVLGTGFNVIAAAKTLTAARTSAAGWAQVRPPLVALTTDQQHTLRAAVAAAEPVLA
ncbi:MAG: dihydrodipicolinate synthase family protein [Caldilineaceae bacterium]